jgi:hypothetical protein
MVSLWAGGGVRVLLGNESVTDSLLEVPVRTEVETYTGAEGIKVGTKKVVFSVKVVW